jgi:TolB protein
MAWNRAAASSARLERGCRSCAVVALLACALAAVEGAAPVPGRSLATEGIVFESTRDGNSEIYLMTVDGAVQVRLTNSQAVDAAPAVSPDGEIVFASSRGGNWDVYSMGGGRGKPGPVTTAPAVEFGPAWSPDGHTIAFTRSSADPGLTELYVVDRSSGAERQLTNLPGQNFAPSFSPAGDRVAFVHGERRRFHIEIASLDGTVLADLSARTGHNADSEPAWSPTADEIAFSRRDAAGNYDIWTMQVGSATERRLTTNRLEDSSPTWSPDGRQIAFVRGGDGAYEVFAMNADGSNQRNLTNSIAGADVAPRWAANVGLATAAAAPPSLSRTRGRASGAGFFCTMVGTRRGETLNGTGGTDVICGLGGRDTIRGLRGGDVIAGGTGGDRMFGGRGGDSVFARVGFGRETDVVFGGAGVADLAWVDRGIDTVKRDVEVRRPP